MRTTGKKGKGTGAVTTSDGTYTLQLPGTGSYIITASYVGYQTAEKKFTTDENKKLSFRLSENQIDLGTVVVTGTRTPKLLKDAPIITRDRKSTRLNSSHKHRSRMPSSA